MSCYRSRLLMETAGTFVNTGYTTSFNGVARAWDNRGMWKVLRVLGNLLKLDGFDYEYAETVRDELCTKILKEISSRACLINCL